MNAYKDENGVSTLIATENSSNLTITRVLANESTHRLKVNYGAGGTDYGNNNTNANKDENGAPVFLAVSSVDGFTPVEVYCTSTGALLINSN